MGEYRVKSTRLNSFFFIVPDIKDMLFTEKVDCNTEAGPWHIWNLKKSK